jgi:hypothetical protein
MVPKVGVTKASAAHHDSNSAACRRHDRDREELGTLEYLDE